MLYMAVTSAVLGASYTAISIGWTLLIVRQSVFHGCAGPFLLCILSLEGALKIGF